MWPRNGFPCLDRDIELQHDDDSFSVGTATATVIYLICLRYDNIKSVVVLPRQCKAQRLRRQTPPDTLSAPPEVTAAYRGLYNNSVPIDYHYFLASFLFSDYCGRKSFFIELKFGIQADNINIEFIEDDDPMNRFEMAVVSNNTRHYNFMR